MRYADQLGLDLTGQKKRLRTRLPQAIRKSLTLGLGVTNRLTWRLQKSA